MQARKRRPAVDDRVGQEGFTALLHRGQQLLVEPVEIALDLADPRWGRSSADISKRRDAQALARRPRTPDVGPGADGGMPSPAGCRRRSSRDSRCGRPAGARATP